MEFEWDLQKAESNLRKHGITFENATLVFEDENAIEEPDLKLDYDEERWILVGLAERRVFAVVYTLRETKIRIISARKADTHERQRYRNG